MFLIQAARERLEIYDNRMWQKIYLSFADTSAEKNIRMGAHFKAWIDLFCGGITNQSLSQAVILF